MLQTSLAIERCAQEHKLGAFQKAYAEFISPLRLLLASTICGATAIGMIWIVPVLTQIMYTWIAVTGGLLCALLMLWGIVYIWRQYSATKGTWLYLYRDGFVYERQGSIQGYHITAILSIDTHEKIDSNGNRSFSYTLSFADGEQLKIKHGAELKSRLRER